MRLTVIAAVLLLLSSATGRAQDRVPVERRVDSLERQMRSVQRRVFNGQTPADAAPGFTPPAPVAAPVNDLGPRVDALERQLSLITGQVEETQRAQRDLDARLDRLEAANVAAPTYIPVPAPAPAPAIEAEPTPDPAAATSDPISASPASTDPAENLYLAGYRLWEGKRYDEAAGVLKDMAAKHPKHRRASWARNLLGRSYLDAGKPATAAEAFLSNYQDLPQGDRAPDSLYFLGSALMKLNKPEQACKVYDELGDVYATTMRSYLKQNLPAARRSAKCKA